MTYRCMEKECGKVFSLGACYQQQYVECPHCKSKLVIIVSENIPVSKKWWEKKDDITDR